jgi:hypothetical protein
MAAAAVVRGYKLVTADYRSITDRGRNVFAVDSTHAIEERPVVGKRGFHFSPTPLGCLMALRLRTVALDGARLLEVDADAADVATSSCGNKLAARRLRIVGEVADVATALTGTATVKGRRSSFLAGRLHQTSDDAPAETVDVDVDGDGTVLWTWRQHGAYGRCDGNADLPTEALLGRSGRHSFKWRGPRRQGRPTTVVVEANRVVSAVRWDDEDDQLARISPVAVTRSGGVVEVDYGGGLKLTIWQDPTAGSQATVVKATPLTCAAGTPVRRVDLVVGADGELTAVDRDERVDTLVGLLTSAPALATFAHWCGILDGHRPPVDVIDVVLAAQAGAATTTE